MMERKSSEQGWEELKKQADIFFSNENYDQAMEAYKQTLTKLNETQDYDYDEICREKAHCHQQLGKCYVEKGKKLATFEHYLATIRAVLGVKKLDPKDNILIKSSCLSLVELESISSKKVINDFLMKITHFTIHLLDEDYAKPEDYKALLSEFNRSENIKKDSKAKKFFCLLQVMLIKYNEQNSLPPSLFKEWLHEHRDEFEATYLRETNYYLCYTEASELYLQTKKSLQEDKDQKQAYVGFQAVLNKYDRVPRKERTDDDHRLRSSCYAEIAAISYARKDEHKKEGTKNSMIDYYTHSLILLTQVKKIQQLDVKKFFALYEELQTKGIKEQALGAKQIKVLDFYNAVFSDSTEVSEQAYQELLMQEDKNNEAKFVSKKVSKTSSLRDLFAFGPSPPLTVKVPDQNSHGPTEYSLASWLMRATWSAQQRGWLAASDFQKWVAGNEKKFKSDMKAMRKKSEEKSTSAASPRFAGFFTKARSSSTGDVPSRHVLERSTASTSLRSIGGYFSRQPSMSTLPPIPPTKEKRVVPGSSGKKN